MSDELNLENLDAVPAEEPVVEASEAAANEAAAPVEPVADLSAESDASVDNADVESDAPAATESAPVASTQTETVSLDEDEEEVNESEQAEETDAGQQAVDEFSKSLRSLDGKWYVLHTYSGYEKRVKTNIESRVASFGMEDQIFQVEVPMEEVEKHTEKGKKVITRVRVPGYVLIRMWPDENARRIVRETEGVTGFVGPTKDSGAALPQGSRGDDGSDDCFRGTQGRRRQARRRQEAQGRGLLRRWRSGSPSPMGLSPPWPPLFPTWSPPLRSSPCSCPSSAVIRRWSLASTRFRS